MEKFRRRKTGALKPQIQVKALAILLSFIIIQPCNAIQKLCSIKEGITTTRTGNITISSSTKRVNVLVKIPVPSLHNLVKCPEKLSLSNASETFRNTSSLFINDINSLIITTAREKRPLFAVLGATLIAALGAGFRWNTMWKIRSRHENADQLLYCWSE